MGPRRWPADASKPEESIKRLEAGIALDKQYYLPYDPVRQAGPDDRFPRRHARS